MNLSKLLLFHAVVTLAAGIVLIIKPELIPSAISIEINPEQYLICYFLGGAELAIAFLSFAGRKLTDVKGLRLVSATIILFHVFTAILELYAYHTGADKFVLPNVLIRIIVSLLFYYYGIYKTTIKHDM